MKPSRAEVIQGNNRSSLGEREQFLLRGVALIRDDQVEGIDIVPAADQPGIRGAQRRKGIAFTGTCSTGATSARTPCEKNPPLEELFATLYNGEAAFQMPETVETARSGAE